MKDQVQRYNELLSGKSPQEVLEFILKEFRGKIALATSLGAEDQVLTDLVARMDPAVRFFTLDTGRLYQETYDILDITEKKYGIKIQPYFPEAARVEAMVREKGINLFYDSVENRKLCCGIRKVEPLKRALSGMDAWISGLRREQSVTRENLHLAEWDERNGCIKFSPLIEWTREDVWNYLRTNHIPYNALHDKGFPSIGCAPCTRAIAPGEDERSGRWWWELPEFKECGLHRKD
jgi:phosphoadenosine phosphosulfate reductase